jgi:hypothetical protein
MMTPSRPTVDALLPQLKVRYRQKADFFANSKEEALYVWAERPLRISSTGGLWDVSGWLVLIF